MTDQPLTPQQVAELLGKLPEKVGARLRAALDLVGKDHVGTVQARFARSKDAPTSRSGRLAASLGYRVLGDRLTDLQLRTFSAGVPYARMQEFGGQVSPKNVKNLTIPQKAALTAAGAQRFTARELLAKRKDAWFLKDRRGRVWLVAPKRPQPPSAQLRRGPGKPGPLAGLTNKNLARPRTAKQVQRSRDLEFYFLLVPHAIYVPPRLRFFQTWRELAAKRTALLGKGLAQAVAEVSGGAP